MKSVATSTIRCKFHQFKLIELNTIKTFVKRLSELSSKAMT